MNKYNRKTRFNLLIAVSASFALAACTSTDPSLGVEPSTPSGTAITPTVPQAGTGTSPQVASLVPNAAVSNVYFAPIVGAPVSSVTALSRRLSAAAPTNSVALQPSASRNINHEIRGYFSALSEGGSTTVIHVWDVFSPQGQRVHRIQGQEKVSGTGSDPWAVVPAASMERIADTVLSKYAAWRGNS